MNKDLVLRRLQAILNQLTCMNDEEFMCHVKDDDFSISFDHFGFANPVKTRVKIEMKTFEIKED